MKLKIDFFFWVQYRGDGSAILEHEQEAGVKEIFRRANDLFGGYTLTKTVGAFDPGTEESRTLTVMVDEVKYRPKLDDDIAAMVQQIKDSLQQYSVAVTRTEVLFDIL